MTTGKLETVVVPPGLLERRADVDEIDALWNWMRQVCRCPEDLVSR